MRRSSFIAVCSALLATVASGQYWDVDAAFAPAIEGNPGIGGVVIASAQPGGKILLSSSYSYVNGTFLSKWLVRLNPNGELDPTFSAAGKNGRLLTVYPDGRILYGTVPVSGIASRQIKRMLADGSDDPTFSSVPVSYDFITARLMSDGRIYLSGEFTTVGGVSRPALARLNADGTLDETFGSPFASSSSAVNSLEPTADGQHIIIAGGGLGLGAGRNYIARLNNDGSIDPAFNTGSINFPWHPVRVYPDSGGGMVVANGVGDLMRLNASGAQDNSFAPALVGDPSSFGPRQGDGKIYYTSFVPANLTRVQLRRMNQDFTDDASFPVVDTPYATSYTVGLPIVSDDGTLCLGPLTAERQAAGLELSRVLANGSIDPGFNPRFSRPANITAHERQPDGRQLLAGAFKFVNNVAIPDDTSLMRFEDNGAKDPNFNASLPAGSSVTRIMVQPDGGILAFGTFPLGNGNYEYGRRFLSNGQQDPAFSAIGSDLWKPGVDGIGRIYGSPLIRYLPNGQVDSSYQPSTLSGALGPFSVVSPDGSVFTTRQTVGSTYSLTHLLPNGAQDPDFAPQNVSNLVAMVGLPDGRAVIGTWNNVGDGSRYLVFRRIRSNGTFDYNYTSRPWFGSIATMDIQLAIAGVLFDLLREASPGQPAQLWADLSDQFLRVTVDCATDGTMTRIETPNGFGTIMARYRRPALTAPSFPAEPFVLRVFAPQTNNVPLNSSVQPSVTVAGLAPFNYQWLKDGSAIPGATSFSLPLSPLQADAAGTYAVTITNPYGSVTSSSFALTVDTTRAVPLITTQPSSQTVAAGSVATFTVAATGAPAPSIRWRRNGSTLSDGGRLSGATTATLTITGAQPADAGSYDVLASNSVGSRLSNTATLNLSQTITFPSLADRAFAATSITLSATASSGLPLTFSVPSGSATVSGNSLTLTGSGAVTVRASQAGDGTYAAAPDVDRPFVVTGNFDSWQVSKFTAGERADANVSGPNAIYGLDGLSNLVKYALGLEPKQNITTGLPAVTTTATDWVYTYTRPSDRPDIAYSVEVSINLASWTTTGITHERVSSSGGTETWRGRYPLASTANVFFRLKVMGQ